jgi:SAM-dependent methyltransferase
MTDQAHLHAYYELGGERDRLAEPIGQVEFLRTLEVLHEQLPPAPATVADIGGGPGRYSRWLADEGYAVHHRDLVPLHVEQLRTDHPDIDSALADARALDLPDDSADAVLLLGPLYHLEDRGERLAALREAARVLRPGGVLVAAAISRWAARLDGVMSKALYRTLPDLLHVLDEVGEPTGVLPPLYPGSFTAYTHRPDELRAEVAEAGLEVVDLVAVESILFALADLEERLADPDEREVLLASARALQRVPELLGIGPHLLVVARAR